MRTVPLQDSRRVVCYLENGTSGGGSFESLAQLVTHLDRRRYEPIAVFVNDTPYRDTLRAAGIDTYCLTDALYSNTASGLLRRGSAHVIACARRIPWAAARAEALVHRATVHALVRIIRTHQVSLLHCNNNPVRDAYGIIAARAAGIPVVCHLRSVRVSSIPPAFAEWIVRSVRHCIANSEFAKTWWHEAIGIASDRVTVIPNPINVDAVTPVDVRRAWGIPAHAPVVCCVANFATGKGHALLLDAFGVLRKRDPIPHLLLIGDGPLRGAVTAQARALGIADVVHLAGFDTRARAIIAGCDVLAVPSETETFGRVIIDAFAVGTPVVATHVGGIPELVRDGTSGLTTSFGDPDAFATALLRVLRDRALAAKLRTGGMRVVASGVFSPQAHAARVAALYDALHTAMTVSV